MEMHGGHHCCVCKRAQMDANDFKKQKIIVDFMAFHLKLPRKKGIISQE